MAAAASGSASGCDDVESSSDTASIDMFTSLK
jgi:hypothetical protein